MPTVEEQLLSYLNNAVKPSEIPVLNSLSGTEFSLIYNPSTNKIERSLVNNYSYFIDISNTVFRLIKSYTGSVKNTGINIEINDIIKDGVIRNNSVNLHILSAKYNGGDVTDFGVYNATTSAFTGGNYTITEWNEL